MRNLLRISVALLCFMSFYSFAQTMNLMPLPANVQHGAGSLHIDSSFSISITGHDEPRLQRAAARVTAFEQMFQGKPRRALVIKHYVDDA